MRPLQVAAAVDERHGVLRHGHVERGLGHTRAVGKLRHEQVIAREERFFERRGGNDEVLEKELVQKIDGCEGEYNGIHPTHEEARFRSYGRLAPPSPLDVVRDVGVEDEGHYQQSPPRFNPKKEEEVEGRDGGEFYP